MTYTEVSFKVIPQDIGQQILLAQLSELQFESFAEDDNNGLTDNIHG